MNPETREKILALVKTSRERGRNAQEITLELREAGYKTATGMAITPGWVHTFCAYEGLTKKREPKVQVDTVAPPPAAEPVRKVRTRRQSNPGRVSDFVMITLSDDELLDEDKIKILKLYAGVQSDFGSSFAGA